MTLSGIGNLRGLGVPGSVREVRYVGADGRNEQAWQTGEDERVSILGVAKQRLPGYLAVFTVTVVCVLVIAIVSSWDSIGEIIRYIIRIC